MEPPKSSERLTWVACCTVEAIVRPSAVPLVLRLPVECIHPLLRPLWAFVALGLALVVASWLWDYQGRW
jgi:hypothetical protein